MTLWIVSPMLRDTESFVRLRGEVAGACATASLECGPIRHLVVDDSAGTDPDVARLTALDDVVVLTPPFNLGHQRAIVYGLRSIVDQLAADDIVVTMDSDGEDQPADVPRLVTTLTSADVALALALRTSRTEPLVFRVMYLFFRVLFRVLTGTTVRSGNFAAQRATSLAVTINHPSFDLCYSSTLLALRRPTATVPCARGRRFAGQSRMNRAALLAHGIRMMLPFSERIAVRLMVVATATFTALATMLVLLATDVLDHPGPVVLSATTGLGVAFLASFTAFVVLFSGFSQTSAIAMQSVTGLGATGTDA